MVVLFVVSGNPAKASLPFVLKQCKLPYLLPAAEEASN